MNKGFTISELIIVFLIVIFCCLFLFPRFIAIKETPQCIWANDPITCSEVIKARQ